MSKTTKTQQSKPNYQPSKRMSSEKPKRDERHNLSRSLKFAGAAALAGTLAFGAYKLNQGNEENKRNVAVAEAVAATKEKRVTEVQPNSLMVFRAGVTVRTDPNINREDADIQGNELFEVTKGELLAISDPVKVENESGDPYVMFTYEEGTNQDKKIRVGFISTEVLGQQDPRGQDYTFTVNDPGSELPENIDTKSVTFNKELGIMANGNELSRGQVIDDADLQNLLSD